MGDTASSTNQSVSIKNFQVPPPNFLIPDLSRPPPGFNTLNIQPLLPELVNPPAVTVEDPKPTAPYYDLPAGLMVPLIRLEDCSYKPLDADDIRLPAPAPPSERLIAAIEAFYAPPSHERPRDGYKTIAINFPHMLAINLPLIHSFLSDGWERLALYEYYKVKNSAKKVKEEEIQQGIREKSRSLSPIAIELAKNPISKKRRYR